MKIFIAVSCLLAVASAGWVGPASYHIPQIGPNGVPLDEPAVVAAKAEHAAAHYEASVRSGHYVASPVHYASHEIVPTAYYSPSYSHYAGPLHYPVIGHNGVPVDTPEVQAARANHATEFAKAQLRNGDVAVYNYAAQYVPINHAVPLDTPEVAHAKVAHFAAHAEAQARNGVHYRKRRGVYATPVIGPHGVPQDEPAVALAKAEHAAAHVEATIRNGHVYTPYYAPYVHQGHYAGPLHYPVIGHTGVPVDTPAVQAARANHAAAHIEAQARSGYLHAVPVVASW